MDTLAQLDHQHIWHPFTQMRDWLRREPIVIVSGKGAKLQDSRGRTYLDANSSIWTNLHGHNHPSINAAIRRQLSKIAHSSALGLANEPASLLAPKLIDAAHAKSASGQVRHPKLSKVFFSDDGSTAMEVALKLAYEYARRSGISEKPKFLSLVGAYHGDTVGAVSLGHIHLFHKAYSGLLFKSDQTPAPYCYRCQFNRAKPERADARTYRKCNWECLDVLETQFARRKKKQSPYVGFVFEPLVQGAAGMIAQPTGWLRQATQIAKSHGSLLIADEVLTGFGRTGFGEPCHAESRHAKPGTPKRGHRARRLGVHAPAFPSPPLFACEQENVQPDFMALAKGLTGGYLPMAATLMTQAVFDAFLGRYDEFKTFFHGHSYTANQLGAAAALANLQILSTPASINARVRLERLFETELHTLWHLAHIGDIRRVGLIAGVELVKNWRTREPFDLRKQAGIRICQHMANHGVLTRPIGNVVVLMPPYCATADELRRMIQSLHRAIAECL